MGLFDKKICGNCKHFNQYTPVYGKALGTCKEATVASSSFSADFVHLPPDTGVLKSWDTDVS